MARAYAHDLQGSIEEFIRARLDSTWIASVEVGEDSEREGLRVIEITIFVDGTPAEIARKEPSRFLSKLRAHLEDNYQAFPIVRFRSPVLQAA